MKRKFKMKKIKWAKKKKKPGTKKWVRDKHKHEYKDKFIVTFAVQYYYKMCIFTLSTHTERQMHINKLVISIYKYIFSFNKNAHNHN